MNRTLWVIQAVGLRPTTRRITLLPLRRPPTTALPKLHSRARFIADTPASRANAGKQPLSTHALSGAGIHTSDAAQPVAKKVGLTGRLKELIRTYGWYALGVYTIIGFFDFSVAFALIQVMGRDRVADATEWLKDKVMGVIGDVWPQKAHEEGMKEAVDVASGAASTEAAAAAAGRGNAALWASVVLAYGIHKTVFLPFRLGVTAAILPSLVKWLQARGWAGIQGTKRAAEAARAKIQHRKH